MIKKRVVSSIVVGLLIVIGFIGCFISKNSQQNNTEKLQATVLEVSDSKMTVMDANNVIYTLNANDVNAKLGEEAVIEYTGLLNKNKSLQTVQVIDYETVTVATDEDGIPLSYQDGGIFEDFYILAYNKLKTLSIDEKIGQLLLVRYPDSNAISDLKKYQFGGFVFFAKDFQDKTKKEVQDMISNLQNVANIPLITAVDEEGGSVVRVSSNSNLAPYRFKSSQELYNSGGLDAIKEDTIKKSEVLYDLGLNVNLAPVVDVSTDPSDYMYPRTLGQNSSITSSYAKTVIEASKTGKVSYTLKHFPGYGNNEDTHDSESVDTRDYDDILNNDIPPFEAGIKAGAEAVLVSHNIVNAIDSTSPASLSVGVHNLLRSDLGFTGVVISDDIAMGALSGISDVTVKAILAGNDMIITTDYEESFNEIKDALEEGRISEELINKLAFKVLAWKYYKGLMLELK